MDTKDNDPENQERVRQQREQRIKISKSIALSCQNLFDARKDEFERLDKYCETLNAHFPLDFGFTLARCLEEIDECTKAGNIQLASTLRRHFESAVERGEELLGSKSEAPFDTLRMFDDLEESLESDIAAARASNPVKVPQKSQPSPGFRLTEEQKNHIRVELVRTIPSWHPDAEEVGRGKYHILSPFRGDHKKGSFVIFPDGRATDFATNDHYDIIDIWAAVNHVSAGEALKILAQRHGFAPISNPVIRQKPSPNTPPDVFPLPREDFFVHKDHGTPGMVHRYYNTAGKVIGFVARYETPHLDKKKHFCPFSIIQESDGRYLWKRSTIGWNGVAPIYRIEQLQKRPDAPIVIVEGEKAADAAVSLFPDHIVLTWQGGSGNAGKADWSQLSGRSVDFIWPDADQKRDRKTGELLPLHQQPGMRAALQIASALGSAGCSPKIVMPPEGVVDGWDLADAAKEGWTAQKVLDHATSHARAASSVLSDSEDKAQVENQDGKPSQIRWRPNDIIADLRIRFDQEVEAGSFAQAFPFAAEFRNYIPISTQNTRVSAPILLSVSDKGQVREIDIKIFVNQLVRWYDRTGRYDYGKVNLTEDQLKTLGHRMAVRLPDIGGEPLTFKKADAPGYAWHTLDVESYLDRDEFKSLPASRYEAEQFSMEYLRTHCPSWHSQFSRMNNRLAFFCYLGSSLDLKAKPQQYLWLKGDGGDGKSVILNVLKKFFGGAAIVTDWPTSPDKFYTERFKGRRLGMIDEASGACVTTDMWKRLTGSGTITIEPKGKQAYEIQNNLLLIVSSNDRPFIKTRRSDLRRLIFSEVMPFNTIPHARFDELLLEEFSDFISLCQALWAKFRGISDLAPVDDEITSQNLEEVHAKVSEFLQDYFEIMDMERIRKALDCPSFAKNAVPHILNRELEKACRAENIDYAAARDYLVGVRKAIPGQVSYSRMDKPRVMFGVVAKPALRKKFGFEDRSFELWPSFSRNLIEL